MFDSRPGGPVDRYLRYREGTNRDARRPDRLQPQESVRVLLLAALLVYVGVQAAVHLPLDAFPDTTPIQVQINVVAPALAPEEIERQMTFPVEMSLGGLKGLEEVRSLSKFGLSQVVAIFADETDIYFARQQINERLGEFGSRPGSSVRRWGRSPPAWGRSTITISPATRSTWPICGPCTNGSSARD